MIIYSGPSQIDGKPIVAIITGVDKSSKNSKTGAMPQVWILRSDIHPVDALRTGEDLSICGNCPHRPKVLGENALSKSSRTCYVNTMSFGAIFRKFKNEGYATADLPALAETLRGMHVRIGAYGDPAAVPIEIWDTMLAHCRSTGYTHQWRTCSDRFKEYCMASCDNLRDVVESTQKGYRTFFVQAQNNLDSAVRQIGALKLAHCPASIEKGKSTTCSKCMACSGTRYGQKSNITILIH
jgi:hypothetical protein